MGLFLWFERFVQVFLHYFMLMLVSLCRCTTRMWRCSWY